MSSRVSSRASSRASSTPPELSAATPSATDRVAGERPPALLVVDDKRNMTRLMAKVMQADATVHTANSGEAALALLEKQPIDVVLCDLKMPDMNGLEVLRACRRLRPNAEFVLMTAYATVGTAVEALKLGAYDYLMKPFEPEAARAVLLGAMARARLAHGRSGGEAASESDEVLPGLLARSPAMKELADFAKKIAKSDVTALLLGETGTGKERLARAIHELSPRAPQRFVALNCGRGPGGAFGERAFRQCKRSVHRSNP